MFTDLDATWKMRFAPRSRVATPDLRPGEPLRRLGFLSTLLLVTFAGVAGAQNIVSVEGVGEGKTRDAAQAAALQDALRKGGETEISSFTNTENFELVRDVVFARSAGVIHDWKLVKEEPGWGGNVRMTIRANINRDMFATTWGEVQNQLDLLGRPRIIVMVEERIDNQSQPSSIMESKIIERLIKLGFDVLDGQHVRDLLKRKADTADVDALNQIARDYGAEIYIRGTSSANTAGTRSPAGISVVDYTCSADIRMFDTDTGSYIASESLPETRGSSRSEKSHSVEAGRAALTSASEKLIDKAIRTATVQWATKFSAGQELVLEVRAVKVLGDVIKMESMLKEIPGVQRVDRTLDSGVATFRIRTTLNTAAMSAYLVEGDWKQAIDVLDQKRNVIVGKMRDPENP